MRKLIAPIIWILLPFVVLAEGPDFQHRDTYTQQEFENVYRDLRAKVSNPINVSSGTITGQFNVGNRLVVSTGGVVTQPLQPCFLARYTGSSANATGDGTTFTVPYNEEIFDPGQNFQTGTGVFTAPVSGKYLLVAHVFFQQTTTSHTRRRIDIVTSNRNHTQIMDYSLAEVEQELVAYAVADMDANDTVTVTVQVSGATKVVDIGASDGPTTEFSGSLIN